MGLEACNFLFSLYTIIILATSGSLLKKKKKEKKIKNLLLQKAFVRFFVLAPQLPSGEFCSFLKEQNQGEFSGTFIFVLPQRIHVALFLLVDIFGREVLSHLCLGYV